MNDELLLCNSDRDGHPLRGHGLTILYPALPYPPLTGRHFDWPTIEVVFMQLGKHSKSLEMGLLVELSP